MDSEAMSVLTIMIILKYNFLLFLWTCKLLPLYNIFSIPINIWKFCAPCFTTQVGLQFDTICPNINTNINVDFHTPRDHLISYNSIEDQIFIPWVGKKKKKKLTIFKRYDFTNDHDSEVPILRSASN